MQRKAVYCVHKAAEVLNDPRLQLKGITEVVFLTTSNKVPINVVKLAQALPQFGVSVDVSSEITDAEYIDLCDGCHKRFLGGKKGE